DIDVITFPQSDPRHKSSVRVLFKFLKYFFEVLICIFLTEPFKFFWRETLLMSLGPKVSKEEYFLQGGLIFDRGLFEMLIIVKRPAVKLRLGVGHRLFIGFILLDLGFKKLMIHIKTRIDD